MVCCCLPCFHYLQVKLDPIPGSGPFTLAVTEAIRWACIILPVYLCIWRYADITQSLELDAQFWGILSASVIGFSLLIYLPIKVLALRYRVQNNKLRDYRWRPSILTHIILCDLPCVILIVVAIESDQGQALLTLDGATTTALQIMVFGLTVTEWMAKFREENLTFDLITAMTVDFFFAYDVISFIMLCTYDTDIYSSGWVYVCFLFAFIAMFRYIPAQPVGIKDKGTSLGSAICIIVSMCTVDIPFVIVRLWTMIEFGLVVSDIIHPLKNIAMICFGSTQLIIIYMNRKAIKNAKKDVPFAEQREVRTPLQEVWDLSKGDVCVLRERNGMLECAVDVGSDVGTGSDNRAMKTANLKVDDL